MEIALQLSPASEAAFARLDRVLGAYIEERKSKKTESELLFAKGRDLSLQIYRGFKAHEYAHKGERGNRNPRVDGKAGQDMRLRALRGLGTRVRPKLLSNPGNAPETDRNGRKLTAWQRAMWAELTSRNRGSGVLAVPFIVRRKWKRKGDEADASYDSRQLGNIGVMVMRNGTLRITADVDGEALVADKYGIIVNAVNAVTADMGTYLERVEAKRAKEAGFR